MAATKTKEERKLDFINRLASLYPDYKLLGDYVDGNTFIVLQHKDGYIWNTKPRYLDGKRQCKEVSDLLKENKSTVTLTKEDCQKRLDEKFGKDVYIIIGEYVNLRSKIEVLHSECGRTFTPTLSNLFSSTKGCVLCYGKTKLSLEEVNRKVKLQDPSYEVLKVWTTNGHSYMKCRHNSELCNNNEFEMRISDFISKHQQRCPICMELLEGSKGTRIIEEYLKEKGIEFIKEYKAGAKFMKELPYDFYLPKYNLLIEFDGEQHFKKSFGFTDRQFYLSQLRDTIKTEFAKESNIPLLRISYKEDILKCLIEKLSELYFESRYVPENSN